MKTKTYRVYGADGHRQRESFNASCTFRTWGGAMVEVRNGDATGTNDYTEIVITAEDPDRELSGQLSDGIFENCRIGRVEGV